MSSGNRNKFIETAFRLSKSSSLWAEFIAAFDNYVAEQVELYVKAPPAEALVAHGRAQALVAIRDDFHNLDANFGKINK